MTNEKKNNLYMRFKRKLISACNKYIYTCAFITKARVYIYIYMRFYYKSACIYIYIYMRFSDDKAHV